MRAPGALALAALASIALAACDRDSDLASIRIAGEEFLVEVADTPAEQERGLMFRMEALGERRGMLFVFPSDQQMAFWMRNTYIPLDIAYIDSAGIIREIHPLQPESEESVIGQAEYRYALEVDRGVFRRAGIGPGARVEFMDDI